MLCLADVSVSSRRTARSPPDVCQPRTREIQLEPSRFLVNNLTPRDTDIKLRRQTGYAVGFGSPERRLPNILYDLVAPLHALYERVHPRWLRSTSTKMRLTLRRRRSARRRVTSQRRRTANDGRLIEPPKPEVCGNAFPSWIASISVRR